MRPKEAPIFMKMIKTIPLFVILIFSIFLGNYFPRYENMTDFPVFYSTVKTILDRNSPNKSIYVPDTSNKYKIPERFDFKDCRFLYSVPVAYLCAPLGFLEYYQAKMIMISLIFATYCLSVILILRIINPPKKESFVIVATWLPFIRDFILVQTNSIILFIIVVALFLATMQD